MRGRPLALAVFAVLIAATPLLGQTRPNSYEFWPHGGFVFFDSDLDLQDNFYYGVRMGFNVSPHVEIELLGNFANSRSERWPMVGDTKLFEPGVNITWNFPLQDEARWRWVPYLTTGLARSRFDFQNSIRREDTTLNFGGGIRWFGNENVGFRAEIRDVHEVDGDYDNIQLLTGITFVSGGKLRDTDGDTVPDKTDECPNTPMGCIVDRVGCEKDGDGDGICDGLDECPDTRQGCEVLTNGCDKDTDGDGVCDGLDKCPGTPKGCVVDSDGCPLDSDGDTVCDGVDSCPKTPAGCRVDAKGCPTDQDGDTVCDGVDRCPNTARGCKVDKRGCPIDSDGDTVCDGIDECPGTPRGMEVDAVGCELEIVIQDVLFDFDRASIKTVFVPILEKVNKAIVDNARMRLALHGHTDSVGPDSYNVRLSERRGESVRKWLVKKGIAEDRLEVVAHGECCPVADNQSWEGRAKNRRVEFKRIR